MAVHIFAVTEENYKICVERGLVAVPFLDSYSGQIKDALISRFAGIKEDDYVLMYVTKPVMQIRGVWQIEGAPFYDPTPVWPPRIDDKTKETHLYPLRCRIRWSKYNFTKYLSRNDIFDLQSTGKLWTWAFDRASGSNSLFSISNTEFQVLLSEFIKLNPFSTTKGIIFQPYPYHKPDVCNYLHFKKENPWYEYTLMALLNSSFSRGEFTDIFGNYSDYLCYVPNNFGKEMDFLLFYNNPNNHDEILSYDILELKLNEFNEEALKQLIGYESWFLQKKVAGDQKMVRTTAIAKSFPPNVVDYVSKRNKIEGKPIKLLEYSYVNGKLILNSINI